MRVAALLVLALGLMVAGTGAASELINPGKVVDLTYSFDQRTIYWPTEKPFRHEREKFGVTPGGYFYAAGKFAAPEHGGTHMDAPIHFNRQGETAERVPLANCIGPAAVIDFSARAAHAPDTMLEVADITKYEKDYGPIPDGAIVVARSGWGRFWPDKKHYLGTDKPGDVAGLHFPGFSPEALDYLIKNRKPAAIVIDTASIDPGVSKDFMAHRIWLGTNRPAFENLAHADLLPPRGATIFCIPMKIGDGTGGPTRIFAVMP